MQPFMSGTAGPLAGTARVPGDKSISHRALMVGALAVGETEIHGLLEGEDVLRSAAAMRALGAEAWRDDDGRLARDRARRRRASASPPTCSTSAMPAPVRACSWGVVATHRLTAFFTGDASLRRRPMARVVTPLSEMGASFTAREGYRLPLAVQGTGDAAADPLSPAGALGPGQIGDPAGRAEHARRDHGHRARADPRPYRADAAPFRGRGPGHERGARAGCVTLVGQPELTGRRIEVPADPSSAAFPLVAALILPGSDILLTGVGLNPHRIGLIETLREMGAEIEILKPREPGRRAGGRYPGPGEPAPRRHASRPSARPP